MFIKKSEHPTILKNLLKPEKGAKFFFGGKIFIDDVIVSFLLQFAGANQTDLKARLVRGFMDNVLKITSEHELFKGSGKDEIEITMKLLERSIMNNIYETYDLFIDFMFNFKYIFLFY